MILALVLVAGFPVLAAATALGLVALSRRWCREGDRERETAEFAAWLQAQAGRERSPS